jgi:DNA-directed RNA polymerase specialized sigma24 family protein
MAGYFADQQPANEARGDSNGSAEVAALESLPDEEVKAALMTLSEESRIAVYYADVEGLSYKEIANITKVCVGTVTSRLYRGRHRWRADLTMVANQRRLVHSRARCEPSIDYIAALTFSAQVVRNLSR